MFRGELDVLEEPGIEKSQAKENMFLPIRDDIAEALTAMEELRKISEWRKSYLESFEYFFGLWVSKNKRKVTEVMRVKCRVNLVSKGCQTAPPSASKSTPD